jgi:nucleotidyltransferase substrate binding protein (TIGR01987 family)
MTLDLSSLEKAVNSMSRAIKVSEAAIQDKVDTNLEEVIRAGVIQNFEFTYDQCVKFIKRWLEANTVGIVDDGTTFKNLLRMAVENQLIDNMDNWVEYRQARTNTSHTYDNDKANDVFDVAKSFFKDAQQLLSTLKKKND